MAYLKSTQGFVYDNLNAPIGTKMVFNQTTSPLGWTKETGSNDVALRLISGTVGTGGTVAFDTCFASKTPTISISNQAVSLSTAQLASHTHPILRDWGVNNQPGSAFMSTNTYVSGRNNTEANGSGTTHTHSNSGTSSAIDMNVSYVDVIIATKA